MKDDSFYLIHISESISRIEQFTVQGRDAFMASEVTQFAVLYLLQTLAESTQKLTDETRAKYPEVEWSKIRGFRNRLVHDYTAIEIDIVWDVVENFLPPLKGVVSSAMAAQDKPDSSDE